MKKLILILLIGILIMSCSKNEKIFEGDLYFKLIDIGSFYGVDDKRIEQFEKSFDSIRLSKTAGKDELEIIRVFDILKANDLLKRDRKVDKKKIETAKYISKKVDKIKRKGKANESLFWDFISEPFGTIIIILFSWELKKDGFDRKAKEQKIIRIIILSGIIIIVGLILLKLI